MQKYYFCLNDRDYYCFFNPHPLSHQQKLRFGHVLFLDSDTNIECVRIPIPINANGENIEDWFEHSKVIELLDRIGRGYKWVINENREGFALLNADAKDAYYKLKELIDNDLPLLRGGGIQADTFFETYQKSISSYVADMEDEGRKRSELTLPNNAVAAPSLIWQNITSLSTPTLSASLLKHR